MLGNEKKCWMLCCVRLGGCKYNNRLSGMKPGMWGAGADGGGGGGMHST